VVWEIIVKNKKGKEKKIVEKPRNSGTMTESAFWAFIRSKLRQASMYWKPIQECKQAAKRPYRGNNPRQRFEYKCSECLNYYPEKFISVDHLIPCGSLNNGDDLKGFVERLFCTVEHLAVLCDDCHKIKTAKDKEELKLNKLKNNVD
jgi:hypothetical protein